MILSNHCSKANEKMGATAYQITSSPTKLKIRNGLERTRSAS